MDARRGADLAIGGLTLFTSAILEAKLFASATRGDGDSYGSLNLRFWSPEIALHPSQDLQPRQGNTDMESIGRCTLSPFNTILPHYELNYPNAPPPRPPSLPTQERRRRRRFVSPAVSTGDARGTLRRLRSPSASNLAQRRNRAQSRRFAPRLSVLCASCLRLSSSWGRDHPRNDPLLVPTLWCLGFLDLVEISGALFRAKFADLGKCALMDNLCLGTDLDFTNPDSLHTTVCADKKYFFFALILYIITIIRYCLGTW
jgi:hypothetical protein